MNHIDLVLAVPLVFGAIKGYLNGFFREIGTLVGLIAGVFLAAVFAETFSNYLYEYFQWSSGILKVVAFITILVGVLLLVNILAKALEKIFKSIGLGFLSRLAGFIIGIVKFGFILSVMLIVFNYINRDNQLISEEDIQESYLFTPLSKIAPAILSPSDFLNYNEAVEKLSPPKQKV